MSDGSYDSLYSPKKETLTSANMSFIEWLQSDNSISDIESKIADTIEKYFLQKSKKGDDCSVILLAFTDSTPKSKDVQMSIDPKQLADNTERIDKLEFEVNKLKNGLTENKKELGQKIHKDNFNKYKEKLNELTIEQSKATQKIDELKKVVTNIQNELSKDDSKSKDGFFIRLWNKIKKSF
jgi:transcriptional regulator of acetoin/glycerol metabolism